MHLKPYDTRLEVKLIDCEPDVSTTDSIECMRTERAGHVENDVVSNAQETEETKVDLQETVNNRTKNL